jgi:endoglucanase
MKSSLLAGIFAAGAAAQSGAWAQCGGIGFTGSTSCVSGYKCVYSNDWYSQCVPGTAATTLKTTTTSAPPTSTSSSSNKKFKWFGINQSCGEFGQGIYPGTWGKEFTFPSTSSIQVHPNPTPQAPQPLTPPDAHQ